MDIQHCLHLRRNWHVLFDVHEYHTRYRYLVCTNFVVRTSTVQHCDQHYSSKTPPRCIYSSKGQSKVEKKAWRWWLPLPIHHLHLLPGNSRSTRYPTTKIFSFSPELRVVVLQHHCCCCLAPLLLLLLLLRMCPRTGTPTTTWCPLGAASTPLRPCSSGKAGPPT